MALCSGACTQPRRSRHSIARRSILSQVYFLATLFYVIVNCCQCATSDQRSSHFGKCRIAFVATAMSTISPDRLKPNGATDCPSRNHSPSFPRSRVHRGLPYPQSQIAHTSLYIKKTGHEQDQEEGISEDMVVEEMRFQDQTLQHEDASLELSPELVSSNWFGRALVLLAAAIYGTNFATVKMIDSEIPLSISASIRFSLAATVVSTIAFVYESLQPDKFTITQKDNALSALDNPPSGSGYFDSNLIGMTGALLGGYEVGIWYCLGYIAQAIALQTVSASKSGFYNALAVVVVPILDRFLGAKKTPLAKPIISAILLAVLGVACFSLESTSDTSGFASTVVPLKPLLVPLEDLGSLSTSVSGENAVESTIAMTTAAGSLASAPDFFATERWSFGTADLYCLAQSLFFGFGYWRLERVSTSYPDYSLRSTVGQLQAVAIGAIVYSVFVAKDLSFSTMLNWPDSLQFWLHDEFIVEGLLWTGIVSTAFAMYLETIALNIVTATELTILMTTTSLWGAGFSYWQLGDTLSAPGWVGGILILTGCLITSLSPQPTDTIPLHSSSTTSSDLLAD
jgi:drug/metabolite transporter (DMT)-like permease